MRRKTLIRTAAACACLAIAFIWLLDGGITVYLAPNAEAVTQRGGHCFCYDITRPAKTASKQADLVWLCKEGSFIASITQAGKKTGPQAQKTAFIKEVMCCSLCK